ncbi:fatty acid desaturase [Vitiosangium sp. GDMCC 1.1324]|uniref:fatty acid desaturase n=1 Tax=Vitiosangium sp. (strain GDMCC 1.1324) TaxID=2138576 RepID=UPI000D37119A|nr:fatty acid desaturase [Vitiosangium sp. GDMCC 1.1324]PTL81632.1 fatty acid desaturase [Vitiosangium sp. GDMCC 1.1324]
MRKKLIPYPTDAWAVLLIFATFAGQMGLYLFVNDVRFLVAGMVALMPFCLSVVAYNHNHMHVRTFTNQPLNRILETLIFLETGSSPFSGTLNHIVGHHASYDKPELDTLNWRRRDGSTMGRHEFAIRSLLWHYPSCFVLGRQNARLLQQFLAYLVLGGGALAALLVYRPIPALIVFVVPMLLMLYALKWSAYAHHAGLPYGDDYTASRTNTGRFYNWFTWNAGYHAAHHFKQALHWTLLPEYHERELATKIPAELQGPGWGEELKRRSMTPAAQRQ